jgi:hypothetical protein
MGEALFSRAGTPRSRIAKEGEAAPDPFDPPVAALAARTIG